jgi:hypothetical protein
MAEDSVSYLVFEDDSQRLWPSVLRHIVLTFISEEYCLHLKGEVLVTHGITMQKTTINFFIATRTSDLA